MQEIKYEVEIKGTTPLLVNRYIEGTVEKVSDATKGAKKQIQVEDKLYTDAKGNPYIPSNYIRGALVEAGKSVQIQGKRKATYSKLMGSVVSVSEDAIPLNPNKWVPYTISAVNPMTRGRMSVTRPKFDTWGLKFILISTDDIPEDKMAVILEEAGKFVGIGDWRPQKKGMFGKFIVTKFKKVAD